MPQEKRTFSEICDEIATASQLSNADFSGCEIDDQEVEQLTAILPANKRLKTLDFSGARITVNAAHSLFYSFIADKKLTKLNMPLWGAVNTPSQKPLMRLQEEFEDRIDYYNHSRECDIGRFRLFSILNNKGLYCIHGLSVSDNCLKLIEEYLVPVQKKYIL